MARSSVERWQRKKLQNPSPTPPLSSAFGLRRQCTLAAQGAHSVGKGREESSPGDERERPFWKPGEAWLGVCSGQAGSRELCKLRHRKPGFCVISSGGGVGRDLCSSLLLFRVALSSGMRAYVIYNRRRPDELFVNCLKVEVC